ncbi:DUF5916 domain-containing protein [Cytophagales bacterium LB-30]|uniref:DUF5916 domain-containing protein n=1 Tax=Shiella aurantiaca TaxID=3058365 RepID=A0ABT8F359_9BACT|nr:DUF5916 domain-containing protein [Shiella aurantiaca]MDN4164794.1 DUF5916 domain-containing protein [Shiella aurantiaca]
MRSTYILIIGCLLLGHFAWAQETAPIKTYTTRWVQGQAPRIDGLENDEAWNQVEWAGNDFTQRSPDDGAAPSEDTQFKILYDAKNLYILIRAFDADPEGIVKRMSRRDGFDGDFVEVNIDSYFDKRNAFSFTSSVSGVKGDEYVSNNGQNWDRNWDPIWYLKTSVDDKGWIAEMRIPLSQLRFADKEEHVWGLQIMRMYFRNQERSHWQYIPQDAPGYVHLFGELHGLKGIRPQKQLEIQPYILAQAENFEKEEGNPFATGKSNNVAVGVDAKIGLTSDITLDLTVNPDFGQVEADPSQVNLTAFQLFFREQRPFFIEGNNVLSLKAVNWNENNLFYSRRIGRRPQIGVVVDENGDDGVTEHVDRNNNTRILGAAKITGKNSKGFSWGLLESVTDKEFATIDSLGFRREYAIEPMTNYLVGRVQQEYNDAQTIVGAMFTATNRQLDEPQFNGLHKSAYSAGIDLNHALKDRKYLITFRLLGSQVNGSTEAITNTQLSPERYFQRPDIPKQRLDTTRTQLSGTAGTLIFGKTSGKFLYEAGATYRSPGLELNDIGFLNQTDMLTQWVNATYRFLNPVGKFRWMRYSVTLWSDYDFQSRMIGRGGDINFNTQFLNFWNLNGGLSISDAIISNADLRGGPSFLYPTGLEAWMWMSTDGRKKLSAGINPWISRGSHKWRETEGLYMEVTYRPTNALNLSLSPSVSHSANALQYIETVSYNDEPVYVIGRINQYTYNMSFRATYMVTPNLSIEYWGQPFATTGSYSELKKVTQHNADSYDQRFLLLNTQFDAANNQYHLDENADGNVDYSIRNPNFNFAQLRSNMVVRWEYIPGSTLFLVWTQGRTESPSLDRDSFSHLYAGLFDKTPHNVFLLKYTYRFVL